VAAKLVEDKFQQGPTAVLIVFKSDTLQATNDEFIAAEEQALQGVQAARIPDLDSIQTYANTGAAQLVSEDGMSSVAVLNFSTTTQEVQSEVDRIRDALSSPTLETYITGEPAIFSRSATTPSATFARWRSTGCRSPWSR